ncbi:MAG: hypothetical protein IT258_11520 [Saprospiraceae bacterium]|nr:hypothetical protein [Saprospiraceae bacterium]
MRILFFFAIAFIAACSAGGPVEVGGVAIDAGLHALADKQNFDYTGFLDKALKGDDAALNEVLKFNAGQDSTATVGHGLVLKALLNKLGDELFSQKLSALPDLAKQEIWASLEMAGATSLKNDSPLTLKALMPTQTVSELSGLYVFDGKNSSFRDCAKPDARYLVVDETAGQLEQHYRRLLKFPYPGQSIVVKLKGVVVPYYGSLVLPNNREGFLVVSEVVSAEAKNFKNTCIAYDIWALGTEPFWYAQVSEAEGLIEYRGMDDERTKFFAYQPPVDEKKTKIYTGINQESGDNIRIAVDSLPCGDGMSDRTYKLTVKLTMNGKEVNGCGIPFEAAKAMDEH